MKPVPTLSADLIRELNESYPERSPDPRDSEREVWMKAGERRAVRHLLARLERADDITRA
jgi:hypothetical protein